jgi:SNF2 family DNA or RNA helicase
MDLSWNYASEQQAYDRAYRIGQEKEVFVNRLVVRNTIEERQVYYSFNPIRDGNSQ